MKTSFLVVALMLMPLPALAEDAVLTELTACMLRNVPQPDSVRGVRLSYRDRTGRDRDTLVKMFSKRGDDGLRKVLLEFLEPAEVKGGSLLMLEREGPNEIYFRAQKGARPKRIAGSARSLPLFGTDFTYEDLEHIMAFRRPENAKLLRSDDTYRKRPVYTVETSSPDSSYERIVTSIDKERCIAVKAELYEKGRGLRKELTLNPDRAIKKDGVWIPQVALMTDLRDSTSTMLLVDSSDHTRKLDDAMFELTPDVGAGPQTGSEGSGP